MIIFLLLLDILRRSVQYPLCGHRLPDVSIASEQVHGELSERLNHRIKDPQKALFIGRIFAEGVRGITDHINQAFCDFSLIEFRWQCLIK